MTPETSASSRQLKFRAWDLDNFNMWYSDRDENDGDGQIVWLCDRDGVYFEEPQLIDRCEGGEHVQTTDYRKPKQVIMQFTGLQDKNGKDIYESDMLEWSIYPDGNEYLPLRVRDVVTFAHSAFTTEERHQLLCTLSPARGIEVIANIYERAL